ncbi:Outer membrane protein assembly factor BamA [Candidatus Ecksteinia adelgidicola]|nr:Outer membrane protein assembly factor BamA [Candidatus Ecksteinia adelgidicola]
MITMQMKKLFIITLLFSSATVYSADKFIVHNIHFKGLQRVSIKTALSNMPIQIGKKISNNDIRNTICSLFSTSNFEQINILYHKKTLIIQVKERPVISKIKLLGNISLKNSTIKKNLELYGLRINEKLDYNMLFNIKTALQEFYNSIGKYNALIIIKVIRLPYNRVFLQFIFQEKIHSKIKQINILGNQSFSKNQLISSFKLKQEAPWWNLFNTSRYRKEQLNNDLNNLNNFYLNRGYANFNIHSTNISLTPNKKNLYITININEGNRYTLSNFVVLHGNLAGYTSEVKKLIKIKKKEFYKKNKIKEIENNIKAMFCRYGYAYPHVNTRFKINNKDKIITLYMDIEKGTRFYVHRIIFKGNNITKDSVLRREMRQIEGSWLGNIEVKKGKERLDRLGYFETVKVNTQRIPNSIDQVDIIYTVKERKTGNIRFGFGYGTESGLNFHLNVHQDNWLGTGYLVGMNSSKNKSQSYTELSISNPYFTMNNVKLNSRIFYNHFQSNKHDRSNYTNKSYGIDSILGFPINEKNSLYAGLSYIHNNISHIKPQIAIWRYLKSININLNTTNYGSYASNDLALNLNWIYNNLDSGTFPTKGNRISLNNKITIPGSINQYYKISLDSVHYIPINNNRSLILFGHARLGYSNGLNRKEAPFYENFHANGENNIRGFSSNIIGPKAIYYNSNFHKCINDQKYCVSHDSIGGNAMVIASVELITPTPFITKKYKKSIRTSLFLDAGIIWDSKWYHSSNMIKYNIPNYNNINYICASIGVTLQWMSPLGPLNFSYSKPIKKYPSDQFEEFQFNMGRSW